MKRSSWSLPSLAGAVMLVACAAPYTPSARDDAAKLRVRLGPGSGFASLGGNLRVVDASRACGAPMRFPLMFTYTGPPSADAPTQPGMPPPNPQTYPRVDMVGSPDPLRSDVVELRLDPGRYAVLLFAARGTWNCGVTAEVALAPRGEHEIVYTFDGDRNRCVVVGSRVEPGGGWKPLPVRPQAELCKG